MTADAVALDRLRRSESLERTMLSLRDARESYDVLAIVARSLGFDFKRPCVAYEFRDRALRPVAASDVSEERRPIVCDDVDLETLRSGVVLRRGTDDLVGILSDGQLRAALALEHAGPPLEAEELRYLRAVAAHVSLALANALAFDQLRRYAAEGAALTDAARTILGFSELEPLAAALCKLGLRLANAERVAAYAPGGGALRRIAFASTRPGLEAPESISASEDAAIEEMRATWGPATVASRVPMPAPEGSDRSTGLLVLSRAARFEKPDLRLIETFVTLAALALRNVDLYEQSTRANRALAESNAFKDDLMAMFAHDFKGPLTVISGFSELLFDVDDSEVRRSAETIVEQTKRLAKLSEDALALAATQSAGFSLQRKLDDVADFVRTAVAPLDRDGSRIRFAFPDEPALASFDRSRLRHAIDNVVGNALKYSTGPVDVAVRHIPGAIEIAVADQGIGIPDAELERIFVRFGRATNARSRGISGSGVGLYIARKIVEVHGGTLSVTSKENEGSTFQMRIPRDPQRPPSAGEAN